VNENNNNELQHNCLRLVYTTVSTSDNQKIISYCLSELPSKFHVEKPNRFPNFTFAELAKQNITSQQLYLWSAPIDLIERYQVYLNQLSTSNDPSWATERFYNCTLPRFGPICQYEFVYHHPHHSSLYEIIQNFYRTYEYNPSNFTCYEHLQCNRGPSPICLDWTEICNGRVDCLDGGLDEEHCWELEMNECKENEYRCTNGQCIPKSFYLDDAYAPDCLDGFDEGLRDYIQQGWCGGNEPLLICEDMTCSFTFLTSSCTKKRQYLLLEVIFSIKDNSVSDKCWSTIKCILDIPDSKKRLCNEDCLENSCPDMLYFPNVPILFGDVYLAYRKSDEPHLTTFRPELPYICHNNSRYDDYFGNASKILFNNTTCFVAQKFMFPMIWSDAWLMMYDASLEQLHRELINYNHVINYTAALCNKPSMYQCLNSSKCISIFRLMDFTYNCPHMDDENITTINNPDVVERMKQTLFKCEATNKYIHQNLLKDGTCDCGYIQYDWCEDENLGLNEIRRNISFQIMCDGFVELASVLIDNRNETDETECEQWECNNIYTRCNRIWNCPNGADEAGCISLSTLNCSSKHHLCVSPHTNKLICLPMEKVNDGNINCLGASDEPTVCRWNTTFFTYDYLFSCMNETYQHCISGLALCNDQIDCEHGDDEQFCDRNRTIIYDGICSYFSLSSPSDVEKFLCAHFRSRVKYPVIYFSLDETVKSVEDIEEENYEEKIFSHSSIPEMFDRHQPRCHRGLDLRVWLNDKTNLTTNTCLCRPSYYGNQCQYQNQRISLAIAFQALSDSYQTPLAIIISLIDNSDERVIHSYEQITYLSVKHCKSKFNIYLLYSTRPKNATKTYAIHIDFYEKVSLLYRGSVLLPIQFPFLPVHRLAFIVNIPRSDDKRQSCSNAACINGKCIKYSNNPQNFTFCQCKEGWSGRFCTIRHTCTCSPPSLCIGISPNNQSICVCPMNKFGPQCLLVNSICQNNNISSTCQNGGQCVPYDGYIISNQAFICNCSKGYSGNQCEIVDNQLILSFDKNIVLSQALFIHFIEIPIYGQPEQATTFRTIPIRQDNVIIRWSRPFHLVFVELDKKTYYLTILQKIYHRSTTINKTIHSSDRCPHIRELFNQTFVQWHLLRRIKYYHLPCQNQLFNLSCFHDEVHLCLCYNFRRKRLANCFNFNHNMTFDCFGQSECENDGQCFQDNPDCPQSSICICQPCFYGRRCQFSTSGFGLSLDAIIGYHILPEINVPNQPSIVQFTLALTIIFVVAGLINSILSIITFKSKPVREVGCGLYLLSSSITTLFITIMFGLKSLILLFAQMTIISNRSFLQVQCTFLDFILRVCLCLDQWLNACVAIERTMTMVKGTGFSKKKSKQAAKIVIVILSIVIVGSCIHEPIYRRLIDEINNGDDDDNMKRIWCTVNYPSGLQVYNNIIQICHFFGPFIINLVSAIILIIKQSRQQANIHAQRSYREILRHQFQQHKHLLIAPVVLVILALPGLIIRFISKCMKSANDSWLYLIGYFISFIPTMLTFVIYILPSKFYKKEFRKSVDSYRSNIQRRFHL
jgi:hypothetical protein